MFLASTNWSPSINKNKTTSSLKTQKSKTPKNYYRKWKRDSKLTDSSKNRTKLKLHKASTGSNQAIREFPSWWKGKKGLSPGESVAEGWNIDKSVLNRKVGFKGWSWIVNTLAESSCWDTNNTQRQHSNIAWKWAANQWWSLEEGEWSCVIEEKASSVV